MLTAHHICKSFNINPILQDISFSINPAERVGLIGLNGCGKTTLLRILAGLEIPDQGAVTYTHPDLRIGYLQQGFEPDLRASVGALVQQAMGDPQAVEAEVERLALEQFEGTVLAVVHDRYFIERFADELWLVAGGDVIQR